MIRELLRLIDKVVVSYFCIQEDFLFWLRHRNGFSYFVISYLMGYLQCRVGMADQKPGSHRSCRSISKTLEMLGFGQKKKPVVNVICY